MKNNWLGEKYYHRALYDEMIYFYQLTFDDDGEEIYRIRGLMGNLVRKARKAFSPEMTIKQKVDRLLALVYDDWGFYCDPSNYFHSSNLYLHYVLKNRSAMPISIAGIILYLAESLSLPIYPVNFPTQLILRVDIEKETFFVDPWDGKYVTYQYLQQLYEGAFGFAAEMKEETLQYAGCNELVKRFSEIAKNALIRDQLNFSALVYIEALVDRHPNSPYEVRDRGIVFVKLGCIRAAVDDLTHFVEKCPHDPSAILLANQISELKNELEPIH
ncbi:SirB1 family protein [Seminibacterium arietis]|uniref:SirB1 family protein n=1 Tax=Seminibacterium arietis TaxID=1173502 RepID=A0ABW3I7F9_9PAST